MSRIDIYAIHSDGIVRPFAEAHNSSACAMWIWQRLAEKYKILVPLYKYEPLWAMFGTGQLSEADNVALGFTFDSIWVSRPNTLRVARALDEIWKQFPRQYDSFRDEWRYICPTILEVSRILTDFYWNPVHEGLRGVCFNQTSINCNPWELPIGDDETRPFDFNRDTATRDGTLVRGLFQEAWSP